jgi:hypothetical protein
MILCKTTIGLQVLKDRSVPLTARQRSAFILFDGHRSIADVLRATSGLAVTGFDIDNLISLGLLEEAALEEEAILSAPASGTQWTGLSSEDRYLRGYAEAIRLTSGLGLRGFRLNLAVEGAADSKALLALLPRLQDALGEENCRELQRLLQS